MEREGFSRAITLSVRALNRALLARQMLLRRERSSVADALDRLVGMQAQVPNAPYVGLWSRVVGFRPEQLVDLILARRAVRTALMRNTLHLVSADDCLMLRPVVQRLLARAYGKADPVKLAAMVAAGRAILEEQPRTNVELGRLMQKQFPGYEATTLGYAVRDHAALVQVPPRGLWGQSCAATVTTAESWLGRQLSSSSDPGEMILRYLRAFGPASAGDIAAWSGLGRLKEAVDRLRPRLATFRDENGRELLDVLNGLRPRATVAAPIRFLPEYDNVLVAYADRSRIIPDEHRARVIRELGRPALLVDGFVRGTWKIVRESRRVVLDIELLDRSARPWQSAIDAEGMKLLAFMEPDAVKRRIGRVCVRVSTGARRL